MFISGRAGALQILCCSPIPSFRRTKPAGAVAAFVAAKSSAVDWKLPAGSGKLPVSFKEFACWRPEPPGFAVSVHA